MTKNFYKYIKMKSGRIEQKKNSNRIRVNGRERHTRHENVKTNVKGIRCQTLRKNNASRSVTIQRFYKSVYL